MAHTPKMIISGDCLPEPAPNQPVAAEMHPIQGSRWFRFTPRQKLVIAAEFQNAREASKGYRIAVGVLAETRTKNGESYADLFAAPMTLTDKRLLITLESRAGAGICDADYEATQLISAAWSAAFDAGVLGMKPERTQIDIDIDSDIWQMKPERTQILPEEEESPMQPILAKQIFEAKPLETSHAQLVTYYHTLTAKYSFQHAADAADACAIVANIEAGTAAVSTLMVKGKDVHVSIRSVRGYLLTEVEFALIELIEAALSERQEVESQ